MSKLNEIRKQHKKIGSEWTEPWVSKEAKNKAFDDAHYHRAILLTTVDKLQAQIKAFRAEIQDCRDAWAPDQPPSDLREFLIDLESVLE